MKGEPGVFYILFRQTQTDGVQFKILFHYFLDPACDMSAIPAESIVAQPDFQLVKHVTPADFNSFVLIYVKMVKSSGYYGDNLIQVKLPAYIFIGIQFNRYYVKI